MASITEFLLARITEDEQVARDVTVRQLVRALHAGDATTEALTFALHFLPSRVLAECTAKRAIIHTVRTLDENATRMGAPYTAALRYQLTMTVIVPLATVYADHEDYDPEWSVT